MDDERRRYFEMFRRVAEGAVDAPAPTLPRGIVTCGSLRFTAYLWFLVRGLRHHGCTLPIELWHLHGEVNDALRRFLEPHGVTFRDAGHLLAREGWLRPRPYGIKPHAILHSSFREVLFLDADNCAYRDPAFLFDTPEFRERRAIFWPDRHRTGTGSEELRRDYGVKEGGATEFESGQIVVDRVACGQALALTFHVNEHSDYYYRFFLGDKDTFRLSFDYLNVPYLLIPHEPGRVPEAPGWVQHWLDGQPLFHHRIGWWKWRVVPVARQRSLPALPPALVDELTAELRAVWTRIVPLRERLRFRVKAAERWARERAAPRRPR
jgi:hypothetical protein